VVLFISGSGTRKLIIDPSYLSLFQLNPNKQMIGSMCSGALLLAALGIIKPGDEATTYPTAKSELEKFGVSVVEKSFITKGHVATAAGCLAAQELVGWVIENLADRTLRTTIINSIQPVGAGLAFNNSNLGNLYSTT
jgi:transcriptional regulator GlxA family with amidase domain